MSAAVLAGLPAAAAFYRASSQGAAQAGADNVVGPQAFVLVDADRRELGVLRTTAGGSSLVRKDLDASKPVGMGIGPGVGGADIGIQDQFRDLSCALGEVAPPD